MDHRTNATPVWPFLLGMAFLFAMSITAPRYWERYAQRSALEPPGRLLAHSKPRAPLAPGAVEVAKSSTTVTPTPTAAHPAESLPRVTTNYTPPTPAFVAPQFALPNLTSGPNASPLDIASATIPGLPQLGGGRNIEATLPNPQAPAAQPSAAQPGAAQPKFQNPIVPPRKTPPAATGFTPAAPTQIESVAVAAPALQPYSPSPCGLLLHGGHKADPRRTIQPPIDVKPAGISPAVTASVDPDVKAPAPVTVAVSPVAPQSPPSSIDAPRFTLPQGPAQAVVQPSTAAPAGAQPSVTTSAAPLLAVRNSPQQNPIQALPKVEQPTAVKPKTTGGWWPEPVDLLTRLEHLQQSSATRVWALRIEAGVRQLTLITDPSTEQPGEILKELRSALTDTRTLDELKLDSKTALEVRLTRHALQRRLDVWESLGGIWRQAATPAVARAGDELSVCLVELDRETASAGETGRQWRDYLMLDSLDLVARGGGDPKQRRELAYTILERMERAGEKSDQNAFLHQGAFAQLDAQLRTLTDTPIDGRALLESIELFEGGGLPSDAHELAEQCKLLDYSADGRRRQLGTWLTSHYRNANLRVTLSADLLNRMLPEPLRKSAPVNDRVLGLPTQGWSTTRTGIGIHFVPSNDSLAVRMLADGVVHAQTQTFSGPVRLFSHSDSNFKAYKDFSLTSRGVEVNPAVANTLSRSRLQSIKTEFDHLPIIGNIVESIAMDEHAQKRSAAQREASAKISYQVQAGLDQELNKHLKHGDSLLQQYIIAPLGKARLSPEVIELQSNEARAIMRLRIAGDDQLASHTPRPRAYSDNVASVQLHQSAANNILERICFQGRTFTVPELYRYAVDELYVPDTVDPALLPADIEITFAQDDPITIRCENGKVELRLAVQELKRAGKVWRDFIVRAEFKTAVIDGSTCFVRDGLIHLSGERLGATSQIALRTVFAKVFPDDMCVPLWPEKLRNDTRFADLDVQQVDIRDGWIGMAIGPRRVQTTMGLLRPRR